MLVANFLWMLDMLTIVIIVITFPPWIRFHSESGCKTSRVGEFTLALPWTLFSVCTLSGSRGRMP